MRNKKLRKIGVMVTALSLSAVVSFPVFSVGAADENAAGTETGAPQTDENADNGGAESGTNVSAPSYEDTEWSDAAGTTENPGTAESGDSSDAVNGDNGDGFINDDLAQSEQEQNAVENNQSGQKDPNADTSENAEEASDQDPNAAEKTDGKEKDEKKEKDKEDKEKDKDKDKEKDKDKKDEDVRNLSDEDASAEAQEENENRPKLTNEELIAQQNLVHVDSAAENYRFYPVDKKTGFARFQTAIRESRDYAAREVGHLKTGDAVYVLDDGEDGWVYVESGRVRGFIREGYLKTGDEAEPIIDECRQKADEANAGSGDEQKKIADSFYTWARETVPAKDNEAELYSLASAYDHTIPKKYVLTDDVDINIREDKSTDARVVGHFSSGELAYLIRDEKDGWYYVESGDVRGFVKADLVRTGEETDAEVNAKGEDTYQTAEQLIEPKDNEAFYYTLTSVKEGKPTNPIREAILKRAAECIGNPYVWGGTSLTDGADCSGFVQSLFAEQGISLPRVAEAQALYGTQIPLSEAEPGDLVFFAKDGYIYHVALYVGNNHTIEAYGTDEGIIANTLDTAHAVWATRVIPDA